MAILRGPDPDAEPVVGRLAAGRRFAVIAASGGFGPLDSDGLQGPGFAVAYRGGRRQLERGLRPWRRLWSGVLSVLSVGATLHGDPDTFERYVRPLLVAHCVECHGAGKQEAGLRLDSRAALLHGGDRGPAIVPGDPDGSLLLAALLHQEPAPRMPRRQPALPVADVARVRQWIAAGAPWPADETPAAAGFQLAERIERLPWIWQVPQRAPIPAVSGMDAGSPVDAFLGQRLDEAGITPAPPADDRTWLRRVSFVLTGLPPTPDELNAFLAGARPGDRGRVVDRLLASPGFGERWARHWMDVVRYAESRGHEDDFVIANAWRYRDYLIRAFNGDVPYDRFVAEHVAGDLLPPRRNAVTGGNESVLGTGWAFLGEEIHNPVDLRQDECDRVDNKVDVLSKAFLGLTVACARCHDHKFDALTQRDYYALSGFVLSSPFRQVRYETMEAHALAAGELAALRQRHLRALANAWATRARPPVNDSAADLLAAERLLRREGTGSLDAPVGPATNRPEFWAEHLRLASTNPSHVLHRVARVALGMDEGLPRVAAAGPEEIRLPSGARVIADFTRRGATPWSTDGPTFGTAPLPAGTLVPGTGETRLARVMPYGAASRDPFWNPLALTPGTEMDSGILGAAARAGRTLLTPKVTLDSGRLHYLMRGQAQVYAGVDSHIMFVGGLHAAMSAGFDTGDAVQWVTQDLSGYSGHRAHLEFSPVGEAPLDLLMVVESPEVPNWQPCPPWWPTFEVGSFADLAGTLREDLLRVVDAIAAGRNPVEPRLAPLADWWVKHAMEPGDGPAAIPQPVTDYLRELQTLATGIRWDSPTAVSWADGTGVDESVLLRGKPSRPGGTAPRGLPEAFGRPRIQPADSSGRLELARQMTEPSNPLLARVFVNRVWQHVFGRGLVATPDNFGFLGERPTHPELLDHLAWQFVHEDDWSLKRLLRRLVLSEAFARSSRVGDARALERDPSNRLWHHMPVRRLEGEAIRDALLAVSGRLDRKPFGTPVPVHLTEFIVGRGRPSVSGPLDGEGRRSVYLAVRRNFLPTMMLAFDLPTPFTTVGRRNVTNVPGQSLVMMNDPFVQEQAACWVARLLQEHAGASVETRVHWLFEGAFARPPTGDELVMTRESLAELAALHAGEPEPVVWTALGHALLNANEFIYLK
ncbi:MAG: PSD1 domain-containing protein [Verrucomicrobiae bacterium]|nr:PSD1 domain-containing protein [Verrucomicrobiae bacterium]